MPIFPSPSLSAAWRNAFVSASVRSLPSLEKPFRTNLKKKVSPVRLPQKNDKPGVLEFLTWAHPPLCIHSRPHPKPGRPSWHFLQSWPSSQSFQRTFWGRMSLLHEAKQNFQKKYSVICFMLRSPSSLYCFCRPAKASRAFLISSGFSRSVITILPAGGKDTVDIEGASSERGQEKKNTISENFLYQKMDRFLENVQTQLRWLRYVIMCGGVGLGWGFIPWWLLYHAVAFRYH